MKQKVTFQIFLYITHVVELHNRYTYCRGLKYSSEDKRGNKRKGRRMEGQRGFDRLKTATNPIFKTFTLSTKVIGSV